nr:HEAT repeat domain-containing protein [Paenibacillus marchantiophytorum]
MNHLSTEQTYELPPNFEELKKSASRMSNWRERLDAVEQLGQWNDQQTINILARMLKNDTVYPIQEAAYRKLRAFGEDAQLPPRKKGDLIKGAGKVFVRIKKSLPEGHTYEEFKEKLQKTRSDVFDTYEGDKGADFDVWLEALWASLQSVKA